MIKRVLSISSKCYVSTKHEQLVLRSDDEERAIPIEDLSILEIDQQQVTITSGALQKLAANNVATIICGPTHHPEALVLALEGHSLHSARLAEQIALSIPQKKSAWQHTVRTKIRNQSDVLNAFEVDASTLKRKIKLVRSGDPTNQEGSASQFYWRRLFPGMKRDPDGDYPNNLLNYGYAIIRACVARSIVGSGMHPAIGIHHSNQYNAYCLADDLMEPYRPFVDLRVARFTRENETLQELKPELKTYLLEVLYDDCVIDKARSPLMIAIQRTAASFSAFIRRERGDILYPCIHD